MVSRQPAVGVEKADWRPSMERVFSFHFYNEHTVFCTHMIIGDKEDRWKARGSFFSFFSLLEDVYSFVDE